MSDHDFIPNFADDEIDEFSPDKKCMFDGQPCHRLVCITRKRILGELVTVNECGRYRHQKQEG